MSANAGRSAGIRFALRSLRSRNYRLFFGGQSISLIGTWMQGLAMGWLVYRLTGSPLKLGVVAFAGQFPSFILGPFAGLVADRFSRRRILIVTQSLSMVQAFALSVLVLTHVIAVWHIIALSIFLGVVFAFDAPTRQAFVIEMTDNREDLSNAIALNSSMFNAARLIGPSIAGVLIAKLGEGICFFVNGISYLAVIASLAAMRLPAKPAAVEQYAPLRRLKEGFVYAFGFAPIRTILVFVAVVSVAGMPYAVLMPVFAGKILGGDAHTLGLLMGCSGAGALVGAVFLASRKSVLGLGRWIALGSSIFALGLMAFSMSHVLWLSAIVLVAAGFGMMVQMASCNTVLQTIVDESRRGRVMGLYTTSFLGLMPFGSLLSGALADKIGPPHTVFLGGAVCLVGSLVFLRKLPAMGEMIRPIYAQLGIIPETGGGAV